MYIYISLKGERAREAEHREKGTKKEERCQEAGQSPALTRLPCLSIMSEASRLV